MNDFYDSKTIHWIDDINIPEFAFILLASKRKSGKSVIIRNLLKKICDEYDIDFVVIFSKTAHITNEYWFIEKQYIYKYDETTESRIKKIMNYQEKNLKSKKIKRGILCFDDIMLYKKNIELMNLATLSRHLNLFNILWCQYPKFVCNSIIRANLDLIFFNDLNFQGEQAVYESIHIPFNFKEFHNYIDEHNENYQFLLYDNWQNKKDRIKIIKADIYDDIKLERIKK